MTPPWRGAAGPALVRRPGGGERERDAANSRIAPARSGRRVGIAAQHEQRPAARERDGNAHPRLADERREPVASQSPTRPPSQWP